MTGGVIVGREAELAQAAGLLDGLARGPGVLHVVGIPGIGKTALWRAVVADAETRGLPVLMARPSEAERALAFAGLADLLDGVGDEMLAGLPTPQRIALEVALLRRLPDATPVEPRAVGMGLLNALRALTPVVVATDDLQWLDPASAAALSFALRRLTDRDRVAVIVTSRSETPDVLGLDSLAPGYRTVVLGPLPQPGLRLLLAERLDGASRATLDRVAEVSGGHPLHALELARASHLLGSRPRPGDPLPVTESLGALVRTRIEALTERTRDALLTVALVAEPTTRLLEDMHGVQAFSALLTTGLVTAVGGRVHVQHPLYAQGAQHAAPVTAVRRRHAELAAVVDRPEEQARHRALASTGPDGDVATALEAAATAARARGALLTAGELLEQSADRTPGHQTLDITRRRVMAAECYASLGDFDRTRDLAAPYAQADPRAHLLVARADAYHGGATDSAAHGFAAVLARPAPPAVRVAALLGLAFLISGSADFSTAARHARRAHVLAESLGESSLIAQALAFRVVMDCLAGHGLDDAMLAHALALEDREEPATPFLWPETAAALVAIYVDRNAEARDRLDAVCARARAGGEEFDLASLLVWSSWLHARAGELAAAAAAAEEAIALSRLVGNRWADGWARTQLAWVLAHVGDAASMETRLAEAVEPGRSSGNHFTGLWAVASRALLELSRDRPSAAWAACEPAVAQVEEAGIGEPVTAFFLADALEAMVDVGEVARAERLVTILEQRGQALGRASALATAARGRGLVLAAHGDVRAARSAFDAALVEHDRVGMPFDRARTLLLRGLVERRAFWRRDARISLTQARDGFEELGARLWAAKADRALASLPIRPTTPAGTLTAGEHRVAELVATGLSNIEVATELVVSVKTVEATLTRVYRKLGVRSRTALTVQWRNRPEP